MDTNKSIEIIEQMLKVTRSSFHRISLYFIIWGTLLGISGIVEFIIWENPLKWMVWPIAGILGGIMSGIYSKKESGKTQINSNVDRLLQTAWLAFGILLIFTIFYSLYNKLLPHSLILIFAGFTTFISGSIIKFKFLNYGGIALGIGAILCGFFIEPMYSGLVFAISLIFGYVLPGIKLRKIENE